MPPKSQDFNVCWSAFDRHVRGSAARLTRYARQLAVCFEHSRLREQCIAERRRDDPAFEHWLHGRLLGGEIGLAPAQAYADMMK